MKRRLPLLQIAPGFLGAFFFSLLGVSCKEKREDTRGHSPPLPAAAAAVPAPAAPVPAAAPPDAKGQGTAPKLAGGVRFLSYNVENWLTMDRYADGKPVPGRPKPEKERQAVVEVILSAGPDILGISEIGNEGDLKELQSMLEKAGLPMPHAHLNRGGDTTRSLALLSRHPISATAVRDDLDYRLEGREHAMQRGILDATVDTPAGSFRFLGVHLKSKREVEEGDQEEMRRSEAHLLRREIDEILKEDPQARLVVYGDFNDTRQSPAVKTIHGSGNGSRLNMIALKDSRGHYWTHHWDFQDVYSRIDYVLVSRALKDSVDWDACRILDGEAVAKASDHRPLLVVLR